MADTLPTVLVIDDEPRSLETLRRTLEEEFEVLTAKSATDAEALLEREWVQAIICDQRMPGESGVDFLSRVRERWPEVVRIIISGYTDAGDLVEAINKAGILESYAWPGNVRELQNELKRMLVLAQTEELDADLLSAHILQGADEEQSQDLSFINRCEGSLKERMELLETRIVKETLIRHRWNKTRAADELGLSRVGLRSKLERYGLEKVDGMEKLEA